MTVFQNYLCSERFSVYFDVDIDSGVAMQQIASGQIGTRASFDV